MINYIKNIVATIFKKEPLPPRYKYTRASEIDTDRVSDFSYSLMSDPRIRNSSRDKSILLVDDIEDQFFLYEMDFRTILVEEEYDVDDNFSVVEASGEFAGFKAMKFIIDTEKPIAVAIVDITLGTSIKLSEGGHIELDGVDIAIKIKELFPEAVIKFCSAHPLNRRNPDINTFIVKWEEATGTRMEDHYFSKKSNRAKNIFEAIKSIR